MNLKALEFELNATRGDLKQALKEIEALRRENEKLLMRTINLTDVLERYQLEFGPLPLKEIR